MKTKNLFENKILRKKSHLLEINTSIKPININQEIQTSTLNSMNNTKKNLHKQTNINNMNRTKIKNNKKTPEKILLTSIYNLSLTRNYYNSPMKTYTTVRNSEHNDNLTLYSNRYKDNNTVNYTMNDTNYTIDNTINNTNNYTINNTVNSTIYKNINYSMNNTQNSENLNTQSQINNEKKNINKFNNNIEYNNTNKIKDNKSFDDNNNEMNSNNQNKKVIKSKKKVIKNNVFNLENYLKEKLYSDIEKKMEVIYKKKNLEDKRLISRFIHMHQVLTFWEGVCNYVHPIISNQKYQLNKNTTPNKNKKNEDNKGLNSERIMPLPKLLTNDKIWEKRHKEKIKKEIEFYQKLKEERELKDE